MRKLLAVAFAALAAGVLGTHAQTSTNATPSGLHVLQGDFENGASPTLAINPTANTKRLGYGGSAPARRCNQPIYELDLPSIPAGETLTAAILTLDVGTKNGAPLFFDVLASLMSATDNSQLSADDFVAATVPLDTVLSNGLVFAQIDQADIPSSGKWEIPLAGAALTQLAGLYDASGDPTQSKVFLRLSTSITNNLAAYQGADRVDFSTMATNSNWADFGLELYWGALPENIYYVATTPTNWAVGAAWSDGNPASAGDNYYVTNGVALQTPSTTATFPGLSLNLTGSQTVELMVTGSDVITFPSLDLNDDTLRAGAVGTNLEAVVDGTLNATGDSTLGGISNARDLRVSALITGSSTVKLQAPGNTVYIDNAGNTFDGTWNLTGNFAEFASPAAVGTASITVGNFGKLRILGDWNGLATGESLTVADSASALVDVGANNWTVSALTFGGSNVVSGATYTTDELNAYGTNAVFTGAGTIQVGIPAPPTPISLLAGWDDFSSVTAPTATVVKAGIIASATASAVGGTQNWTLEGGTSAGRGSSADGTWGTYDGSGFPASTVTNVASANLALTNGKTDGEITMTVSNNTGSAVNLGSVHFDVHAFRANAARTYQVNVLEGSDITVGTVFTSEDDAIPHAVLDGSYDQHQDIDVSLAHLGDSTLEDGEVAIIQLAFSSGTGSGSGHHLFVDNVGISEAANSGPIVPPVMGVGMSGGNVVVSWTSAASFKLQTRPNLVFGDWVDVPGGTTSPVSVPATNDVEFLRLIQQ